MILANKWDSAADKMAVEGKDQYTITSGDKYLHYSSASQSLMLSDADLESSEGGLSSKFQLLLSEDGLVLGGAAERGLVAQQHGLADGGQYQLIYG